MLINADFAEESPELEYFKVIQDTIFIGTVINNKYDEKRINLNPILGVEPKRFIYNGIKLYGHLFEPKGEDRLLVNELKKCNLLDLITYSNILEKYNYNCGENFINLTKNIFPLDTVHIERYIPNYLFENFISFNDETPKFQQYTSIVMYILPVL